MTQLQSRSSRRNARPTRPRPRRRRRNTRNNRTRTRHNTTRKRIRAHTGLLLHHRLLAPRDPAPGETLVHGERETVWDERRDLCYVHVVEPAEGRADDGWWEAEDCVRCIASEGQANGGEGGERTALSGFLRTGVLAVKTYMHHINTPYPPRRCCDRQTRNEQRWLARRVHLEVNRALRIDRGRTRRDVDLPVRRTVFHDEPAHEGVVDCVDDLCCAGVGVRSSKEEISR